MQDVTTAYAKLEACLELWETPFFAGESPAGGDFHTFEMIDQHELMAVKEGIASPLASCPKLTEFYNKLKEDPKLAKYFASDASKLDCNNKLGGAWYCQ